jgi:DNA-directed RNA polymerase subunit RPC12/RpoP
MSNPTKLHGVRCPECGSEDVLEDTSLKKSTITIDEYLDGESPTPVTIRRVYCQMCGYKKEKKQVGFNGTVNIPSMTTRSYAQEDVPETVDQKMSEVRQATDTG